MEYGTRSAQMDTPAIVNATSLFETLSTDALSIIVKRIISRFEKALSYGESMHCRTNTFEEVRFLVLLFSENSPFRAAAAALVSQIGLHWSYPERYIDSSMDVLNIVSEMFEINGREIELGRNILSACGPYVRKVIVRAVPEEVGKAKDVVERLTSHVFQYCPNVEEVKFWEYCVPLTKWGIASSLFRKYGATLRKIDWHGEEDENGFPDLRKCTNTRRLKSHNLNTGTLISLLKACGLNLEELDVLISPVVDSVEVIEAIRNYCKKLSVIGITNLQDVMDTVGHESYTSFLCSYGSQLKRAQMKGLGHEHLVEVVNACTNLEVTVHCMDEESVEWQLVQGLGPRVVCLHLSDTLFHAHDYSKALQQCSNLRELYMLCADDEDMPEFANEAVANVFSPSCFPKLEHLTISNFEASERNMILIASCTRNLKSAFFASFPSNSKASAFRFIADSNRHLRAIGLEIYSDESAESALEVLSVVVNIFRKCRKLDLEILQRDDREVMEQDLVRICKVLPCRNVDVHVRIGWAVFHYPN